MAAELSTSRYVEELMPSASGTAVPFVEMKSHPQVHAILLNHISKSTIEEGENTVRVSFMVVSTLQSGFSSANFNIEKPPPKGTKRDPADNLYISVGKGMQIFKTYKLIGKGNKGPASTSGACVMPGMIFQSSVFKDQLQEVFGPGDSKRPNDYVPELPKDLPIFSQVIVTLCSRSSESNSAKNGGLLQVKRVVPFTAPLVFGARALTPDLFCNNLDASMTRRTNFTDSDTLTTEAGYGVDQSYIQSMLSQTRHVIRIPPESLDGDIGRNADGTLYIQVRRGLDRFGVDVSRIRLHDPNGYLASLGPGDWVENLLRFAMARGAMSVVFTYDSMRQTMSADDQILDGFCMIFFPSLLSMCVQETPLDDELIPEDFEETFFPEGKSAEDFDVFIEDGLEEPIDYSSAMYAVVSKRVIKRPGPPAAGEASGPGWWPTLCHHKQTSLWKEGRMVRVYKKNKLVLYFLLSSYGLGQVRCGGCAWACDQRKAFLSGGVAGGGREAQVQRA